jgi:carboxyl-terminal processing protease
MSSKARLTILLISAPVLLLVVVGGFLSKASAREGAYTHLRVFEDVVSLILNNYVEEVNSDHIMKGAMEGLAEGLDPDSAYLAPGDIDALLNRQALPKGDVGLQLTRQYYLRVIAARDGSPAAKAGLLPGDFIRAIDGKPTREMSVVTGARLLRGAPGSSVSLTVIRGNAAEPHTIDLVRDESVAPAVSHRTLQPGILLVRVAAFGDDTPAQLREAIAGAHSPGTQVFIDLRGTAEGDLEDGLAAARLFVKSGVLASRQTRDATTRIEAQPGDGPLDVPVTLLVDHGTAGAAELFAAALSGNGRAALVGEHTVGRTATQELVKLPDGSALWLSTARYLSPKAEVIHEKGLAPDVEVEVPDVEFGAAPSTTDPILEKAIERASKKQAA